MLEETQGEESRVVTWVADHNEEAILYPDLEQALIGICEQFGRPPVAVYDFNKCIDILKQDGTNEDPDTDYDDAIDYFYYNTLGTWAGDSTPVFITLYED